MATARYEVLEIRFVFEPELTQAYVLCSMPSDGMLGVSGWHHKTFPLGVSVLDILQEDIARGKYLTEWGQKAP